MTHIATMGTSSCATIAIGGFKDPVGKTLNEKYIKNPDEFVLELDGGFSVEEFYKKILYPSSQPLGRTGDYPFELLMEELDKSKMSSKYVVITLNSYQNMSYWPKQLSKWGFKLVDKTKNEIGTMNYIYIRNPNRPFGMKVGTIENA